MADTLPLSPDECRRQIEELSAELREKNTRVVDIFKAKQLEFMKKGTLLTWEDFARNAAWGTNEPLPRMRNPYPTIDHNPTFWQCVRSFSIKEWASSTAMGGIAAAAGAFYVAAKYVRPSEVGVWRPAVSAACLGGTVFLMAVFGNYVVIRDGLRGLRANGLPPVIEGYKDDGVPLELKTWKAPSVDPIVHQRHSPLVGNLDE